MSFISVGVSSHEHSRLGVRGNGWSHGDSQRVRWLRAAWGDTSILRPSTRSSAGECMYAVFGVGMGWGGHPLVDVHGLLPNWCYNIMAGA